MSDLKQKLAELEEKYRTSPNLSGYDRKDTLALLAVIEKLIEQRDFYFNIVWPKAGGFEPRKENEELAQLLEERTK